MVTKSTSEKKKTNLVITRSLIGEKKMTYWSPSLQAKTKKNPKIQPSCLQVSKRKKKKKKKKQTTNLVAARSPKMTLWPPGLQEKINKSWWPLGSS
jgi:hypothetical protein